MENSYLIQRLDPPLKGKNPFAFGGGLKNGGLSDQASELLKPIFSFDYMGSAEFEFGAVAKAFQRFAENQKNLVSNKIGVETRHGIKATVYYMCIVDEEEEIKERIRSFAFDEHVLRTKERVMLQEAIDGNNKHCQTKGWLEINNGYIFFIDKNMWEQTSNLFGVDINE